MMVGPAAFQALPEPTIKFLQPKLIPISGIGLIYQFFSFAGFVYPVGNGCFLQALWHYKFLES